MLLTQEQADKIIAVIKEDATIRFRYFGIFAGEACVIGGLATAAKKKTALKQAISFTNPSRGDTKQNSPILDDAFRWIRGVLHAEYGLDNGMLIELQHCNDRYSEVEERRNELKKLVNSWVAVN